MTTRTSNSPETRKTVICAICETSHGGKQSYCNRCLAPLELSRLVASRGVEARFLSVLGASAAGKTVYLGTLLDMLSKGASNLKGLPNGSFSVAVQQQTMTALENRHFPQKTPSEADHWRWIHCEVSGSRKNYVDLVTPDFAGEAVALELEHPGTSPTIQAVVRKSAGHMVLLDSLQVRDAGRDADFFAMKLASYVANLHREDPARRRGRLKLPIAIVLTKADSCPEAFHDPSGFAVSNLPGLAQFCDRNFANYRLFAAGVVGSMATVSNGMGAAIPIPLHIEPRGILEPLEWLMTKL